MFPCDSVNTLAVIFVPVTLGDSFMKLCSGDGGNFTHMHGTRHRNSALEFQGIILSQD